MKMYALYNYDMHAIWPTSIRNTPEEVWADFSEGGQLPPGNEISEFDDGDSVIMDVIQSVTADQYPLEISVREGVTRKAIDPASINSSIKNRKS